MKKKIFFILLSTLFFALPTMAQKKKPPVKKPVKSSAKPISYAKVTKPTPRPEASKIVSYNADNNMLFSEENVLTNALNDSTIIKNPAALTSLTSFINDAIYQRAFPGCQILAAKDGKVIYSKSFGTYNYNSKNPITDTTLFDVASVTKIVSTTLAIMKLYDEGKIKLNATLGTYIPELVANTNKANLRIDNLMMHQAGLKSWIPFYRSTLDKTNGGPDWSIYNKRLQDPFTVPVAKNLFIKNDYEKTVWNTILESPLENMGRYVYSDLDLMFLEKVVESITKTSLDEYVDENFYQPLHLKRTMYNPWKKGLALQCAPTENDMLFRTQVVQGYVHDPGAAMLGGVAGHAGVFSTKADMAVIMQMLINGGEYNDKRYITKETVKLFTGYHSSISRRGYCFDKPEKASGDGGPAADICSKSTFGHQGFTGTCVWADPATGIVFIFLSNRVYPNAENSLINRMKIRTLAQNFIYKALGY